MKVKELVEALNLKVLSGENGLDRDIDGCYVSDLLSDVMGNAEMGNIWVTLQIHKNVMAIASLKELACVILVKSVQISTLGTFYFSTRKKFRTHLSVSALRGHAE